MALSDILNALATAGNVLDTPRAMLWELAQGQNPFDVANPFDEEAVANRTTGWDLLNALGIEGQEGFDWTDPLAVASEVALDPLNLLGLGYGKYATNKAGKAIRGVEEANTTGRASIADELAKANAWNGERATEIQQRWMPAEIADETLVRQADMPQEDWLRNFYESHGEPLPDPHALERQLGAAMSMSPAGRSERGFYGELANALENAPKTRGEIQPVYHGTADVFDVPSEAATQERSYSRAGEYSRHPPLHFTTPDLTTAHYYAAEAAKAKIEGSPEAQRLLGAMRGRSASLDDEARRLAGWARDPEMGISDDLIEATKRERKDLQDAMWELQAGRVGGAADIPESVAKRYPGRFDEAWMPQPNIREYLADVRNPITENDWEALVKRHGWHGDPELRDPGAALKALEEAKGSGYDAIVSSPIPKMPGVPLPEEIAPFSYDQLYAPNIARRQMPIPAPFRPQPLPPARSNSQLAALLGMYNTQRQGKVLGG